MKNQIRKFVHIIAVLSLISPLVLDLCGTVLSRVEKHAKIQEVISPNYKENKERPAEENTWFIDGQHDVLNHTGNRTSGTNEFFESVSDQGDPNNFTDHYINYGGNSSAPDYAIRQFARQTETPGLYDVFTNIRGQQQQHFEPLSIVLVSDHSSSMDTAVSGHNRMYYLDQAIENFTQTLLSVLTENEIPKDYIRVGHVAYGNLLYNSGTRYVPIDDVETNAQRLRDATPQHPDANQGTFTQTGLREARAMLSGEENRKKIVILLTDGVPTLANRITGSTEMNPQGEIDLGEVTSTTTEHSAFLEGYSTNPAPNNFGNYNTPLPSGNRAARPIDGTGSYAGFTNRYVQGATSGPTYNSVFPATYFEAEQLKKAGVEVHGIGIAMPENDAIGSNGGTNPGYWPAFSNQQIIEQMKKLVSDDYFFQNIYDPTQLSDYLQANLLKFFKTISNGSVQIKLGEQFEWDNQNQLSTRYFVNGTTSAAQNYTASFDPIKQTITVNHLNLGRGEEIQIHHQVHLQTEKKEFLPEVWRHISDPEQTFLQPTPQSVALPFAVPSGRAFGTQLDLTKIWKEMAINPTERPTEIQLEIKRSTTTHKESWQSAFTTLKGSQEDEKWTQEGLDHLLLTEDDTRVFLPRFNNRGETFEYRIIGESGAPAYDSKISEDAKSITNTELWKFELIKQSDEGHTPAGAVFELKTASQESVSTGVSDAQGKVEWADGSVRLKNNTTYQLIETTPLLSHHSAGPWTIQVLDGNITMSADDPSDHHSVYLTESDETLARFKVILVNQRDVTRLSGEKTWVESGEMRQFRPERLQIELYQNGLLYREVEAKAPIDNDDADVWTYDFGWVPTRDLSGNTYAYTINEKTVPHYKSKVEGLNLENTLQVSKIELSVDKVWEDHNNRAGHRPSAITLQLFRDGEAYGEPVELSGDPQARVWNTVFEALAEYKDATTKYDYEVKEVSVSSHYTKTIEKIDETHFEITNRFIPEQIDISGQKFWEGEPNDQYRPEELSIQLWAYPNEGSQSPTLIATKRVTAAQNWQYDFGSHPKEDESGREINYQVREESIANYRTVYPEEQPELGRFDIKNIFDYDKRDITVTKSWDDQDNVFGHRPESIEIELLQDGEVFETAFVSADKNWIHTFEHLPVYRNHALEPFVYTVREVNVPFGYELSREEHEPFHLINQFRNQTSVSGHKTWQSDEETPVRPQEIRVYLWRYDYDSLGNIDFGSQLPVLDENGNQVYRVLSEENQWTFMIDGLAKYEADAGNSRELEYFVTEVLDEAVAPLYESSIHVTPQNPLDPLSPSHFEITNVLVGPELLLEVNKLDADFTTADRARRSALDGVNFLLTQTSALIPFDWNVITLDRAILPLRLPALILPFDETLSIPLRSGSDGQLRRILADGSVDETENGMVELAYDTTYQLRKLDSVGHFPVFDGISTWEIKTPTLVEAINHIENDAFTLEAEQIVATPDQEISDAEVVSGHHPAVPELGRRALIRTEKIGLEARNPYVISFDILSNVTHPLTIEKIDGSSGQLMDTQFRLRWVEQYDDQGQFDTMSSLDIDALHLSGTQEDGLTNDAIDIATGATLSTVNGSKTMNNMGRGNLYIISENNPPSGYQVTDAVIVAYMDEAQGKNAEASVIHVRMARRSDQNPNLLIFDALEHFPEYQGSTENGIRFANFKIPPQENEDKANDKEKDQSNAVLPQLSDELELFLALLGVGILLCPSLVRLWKKQKK